MADWVGGVFYSPDMANTAIERLIELGYPRESISVAVNGKTRERFAGAAVDDRAGNKAGRGAVVGGAIGGTLGLLLGAAAIVGSGGLAAPFVVGPLAAAILAGSAATAAAGTAIGAVAGGIESEQMTRWEQAAAEGAIVLAIEPRPDDVPKVREILGAEARQVVTSNSPPRA
jgi:hypothetical protein